jgi:hypothetical protein
MYEAIIINFCVYSLAWIYGEEIVDSIVYITTNSMSFITKVLIDLHKILNIMNGFDEEFNNDDEIDSNITVD